MPPLYFMVDPPGYGSTYRNSVAASLIRDLSVEESEVVKKLAHLGSESSSIVRFSKWR